MKFQIITFFLLIIPSISHAYTGFSKSSGKRIGLMGEAKANRKDLDILAGYLKAGKIRSVIDKTYKFNELPQAMAYHEKGHSRGKVVVTV